MDGFAIPRADDFVGALQQRGVDVEDIYEEELRLPGNLGENEGRRGAMIERHRRIMEAIHKMRASKSKGSAMDSEMEHQGAPPGDRGQKKKGGSKGKGRQSRQKGKNSNRESKDDQNSGSGGTGRNKNGNNKQGKKKKRAGGKAGMSYPSDSPLMMEATGASADYKNAADETQGVGAGSDYISGGQYLDSPALSPTAAGGGENLPNQSKEAALSPREQMDPRMIRVLENVSPGPESDPANVRIGADGTAYRTIPAITRGKGRGPPSSWSPARRGPRPSADTPGSVHSSDFASEGDGSDAMSEDSSGSSQSEGGGAGRSKGSRKKPRGRRKKVDYVYLSETYHERSVYNRAQDPELLKKLQLLFTTEIYCDELKRPLVVDPYTGPTPPGRGVLAQNLEDRYRYIHPQLLSGAHTAEAYYSVLTALYHDWVEEKRQYFENSELLSPGDWVKLQEKAKFDLERAEKEHEVWPRNMHKVPRRVMVKSAGNFIVEEEGAFGAQAEVYCPSEYSEREVEEDLHEVPEPFSGKFRDLAARADEGKQKELQVTRASLMDMYKTKDGMQMPGMDAGYDLSTDVVKDQKSLERITRELWWRCRHLESGDRAKQQRVRYLLSMKWERLYKEVDGVDARVRIDPISSPRVHVSEHIRAETYRAYCQESVRTMHIVLDDQINLWEEVTHFPRKLRMLKSALRQKGWGYMRSDKLKLVYEAWFYSRNVQNYEDFCKLRDASNFVFESLQNSQFGAAAGEGVKVLISKFRATLGSLADDNLFDLL